jgi:hypothetical protein
MEENKMGVFFDEQTSEAVKDAVGRFGNLSFDSEYIRSKVLKFDRENFKIKMKKFIENAFAEHEREILK